MDTDIENEDDDNGEKRCYTKHHDRYSSTEIKRKQGKKA